MTQYIIVAYTFIEKYLKPGNNISDILMFIGISVEFSTTSLFPGKDIAERDVNVLLGLFTQ